MNFTSGGLVDPSVPSAINPRGESLHSGGADRQGRLPLQKAASHPRPSVAVFRGL